MSLAFLISLLSLLAPATEWERRRGGTQPESGCVFSHTFRWGVSSYSIINDVIMVDGLDKLKVAFS